LGFENSKRVKNQTFLFMDGFGRFFFTQSPLGDVDVKYQVRESLRDPQSKFRNTLSELKEARDGPAG